MDVTILGRIGYDLYSEEPNVPLPAVRRFSRYLGGSSANMAVGLARLGASVGIIACLGNDSLSEFLTGFLAKEKVDTSHVKTAPGYLPSLCLTEVSPPDRFPQVFYRRDPVDTRLEVHEGDLTYIASSHMFVTNGTSLCASPSRESTYRALEHAHRAGCRVVLDVDYRAMSWTSPAEAGLAVRLALPFVDVLIGNEPELELVAGACNLDEAIEKLRQARISTLVSKLGHKGTRVWTGVESIFLEPYSVNVVSTIGAGDGFASGFLYGLLKDRPILECLHYGNAAAAIVVSRLSCSEAMPTLAEVEQIIREQRSRASRVP
ncbi:MAG TPA: 5-dehydro-2-deoxygluconokinase [Bryobacteraceae bacterium]|nr:5-dehydro-2-deoxygluconokinase [Bryobacteraceae bacterium]